MHHFFEALRPVIRGIVRHAVWVILAAVALSALGLYYALKLRIDTDFANLIPRDYPSVQALETLRATVGAESEAAVAIASPSFEANKAFAEALIPRALTLTGEGRSEPYFGRVDYRRDTEFLEDNALYFATDEELDELEQYLQDQIEEAKLAANPFFFDLEDEEEEPDSTGLQLAAVYEEIIGKEYPISDDSTTLVLRLYPTGSQSDLQFIADAYEDLERLVEEMDPKAYHPEMEVVLAGRLLRTLIEVRTIQRDVFSSFGAGVTAVLLLVVLYFFYKGYRARVRRGFDGRVLVAELARTPVMALLIGLPLLMSLSWTFGAAYLAFETLNLMTSTLGLVLFGLGIDYGIHFYARYTEERGRGRSVAEAAEITFTSTGQAITVGALTTAAGLYVLVVADFKGFSEFGFIAGTGILFALVAMLGVMPALIAVLERVGLLNLDAGHVGAAPERPAGRFPAARAVVLGSFAAVLVAILFLPRVEFEYRFGELEPDYEDWDVRNAYVRRVFDGGRRNPAYIITDDPDQVPAVAAALRQHAARDTLTPTIGSVETLQDRFPLRPEQQQAKLARIAEIRALLNSPYLEAADDEDLARLRRAAQTTAPIAIEQVPEYLRNRFTSKSGEIGGFVIIYPSVGLSDGRNSIAFSEDVGQVVMPDGTVYHAGSTSLVAADMLKLMQREAPWMVGATFVIVVLLMGANFRSVRGTLLAVLPLVVGVLWMLLLMEVFDLRLNFYNLVVLPAVLGIGNDAGVHFVHRYFEEGRGSILYVLRSTGEHITMGSLTTMIGFAGLLLSFHPGLRSIGELAVVGIGTTLLAALVFLPALLQWLEERDAPAVAAPVPPAGTGREGGA
ncbi:MAG: transporter [Bacteroidetes bacterium]|nr:MAG: transporter [Bacteroidota bacterium]